VLLSISYDGTILRVLLKPEIMIERFALQTHDIEEVEMRMRVSGRFQVSRLARDSDPRWRNAGN
jgi:hypothetical protein